MKVSDKLRELNNKVDTAQNEKERNKAVVKLTAYIDDVVIGVLGAAEGPGSGQLGQAVCTNRLYPPNNQDGGTK